MPNFDVAILHSAFDPEPERAAWMAAAITRQGQTVYDDGNQTGGCYRPGENLILVIERLMTQASYVMVLLSRATVMNAGLVYVQLRARGHRLIPVQVEPCQVPEQLAPIRLATIYGVDEAADLRELDAAMRAGTGRRLKVPSDPPFPGQ